MARTLTDRFGVTVVCRGESAYTDGRQIVLPSLPDPMDEDLERMIVGYLDHEMAHVAFSDFDQVVAFNQQYPGAEAMLNVVEDALIEKLAMQRWPGVRANLDALFNQVKRRVRSSLRRADPFRRFCTAVYLKLSHHEDMLGLHKELVGFDDLVAEFPQVQTTADSARLAARLLRRWISRQRPAINGSEGDSKSETESESENDSEPVSAQGDESECRNVDIEESNSPTWGVSEQTQTGEHEPRSDGDEASGDQEANESPQSMDSKQHTGLAGSGASSDEEAVADSIDPTDLAALTRGAGGQSMITGAILESIERAAKAIEGDDVYRVYTRQHDRIDMVPRARECDVAELIQRNADIVRRLRRGLTNALRSAEKRWWREGQPRGELSPRTLHRLCLDRPQLEVFRTRSVVQGRSTAVSIVLDASGSMTQSKMDVARDAVRVLLEALRDLKIPVEAVTFTTGMAFDANKAMVDSGASANSVRKRFARMSNLEIGIIKQFEEPVKAALSRLPSVQGSGLTPLGEAMEIGARRIIIRNETRKILLVITDGRAGCEGSSAACHRHAQLVARRILATGIEVVGVGIQEESLKEVVPDTIVVQDIQDLPAQLCKLLGRTLKKGVCHVG
ncbi:MAG: VWA domain-containing protein [Planctomycetes bacterium]|nr:VWA domain-containing protein [Planctomycetota bacterium]